MAEIEFQEAMRGYLFWAARRAHELCENYESLSRDFCESEIERRFLVAYAMRLQGIGLCAAVPLEVMIGTNNCLEFEKIHAKCGFISLISAQHRIDKYRVDFLVQDIWDIPDLGGKEFRSPLIVVECDGHDYHERTPDQAIRDRSRDRELQGLGYIVLRFTGREIYRDSVDCAQQVIELINHKAQESIRIAEEASA